MWIAHFYNDVSLKLFLYIIFLLLSVNFYPKELQRIKKSWKLRYLNLTWLNLDQFQMFIEGRKSENFLRDDP